MRYDPTQVERDYRRDGVVRIRGFFSPQQVAEIRAELDRYIREDLSSKPADARTLEADDKTIRNLWRLQQHNAYFRELAVEPSMTRLVGTLVRGEPVLNGIETFSKPARVGSGVPHHQDNAYFCQQPPDMLTVWIAIDAVTDENGPVCFIKGSHQRGLLPSKPSGVRGNSLGMAEAPVGSASEEFRATLEPGDATIHHCEVVHYSAANTTDRPRLGLLFVFRGSHTKTDPQLMATYQKAVLATPPA